MKRLWGVVAGLLAAVVAAGVLAGPAGPGRLLIPFGAGAGYFGDAAVHWDFTQGSLVDKRSGLELTFTRASDGTYFDSAGVLQTVGTNAARFDHDPVTGQSLGLLIEEARANNAIHNRDFSNAAWVKTNITAAKDAVGIDNVANSASSLTASAGNGTVLQTVTIASAAFTTSFYVKCVTCTGNIDITDNNGGAWTTLTGLSTTAWTRHDITRTQANPVFGFRIVTSGDEIEVDFAQLEPGAFPTSAIATTTAAVTRAADFPLTTSISWLTEPQGTWYVSYYIPALGTNQFVFHADAGASANDYHRLIGSGIAYASSKTGGNGGFLNFGAASAATIYKAVIAFDTNDNAGSLDGGAIVADTTVDPPTGLTTFRVGHRPGDGLHLNGHIQEIAFWNTRKTNAFLQSITE